MLSEAVAAGDRLQALGTLAMWAAILLRAPHALVSQRQRPLWLIILAAAVANSLDLEQTGQLLGGWGWNGHGMDLVRNVCGVVSAVILLEFIGSVTGDRTLRRRLRVGAATVVPALIVLDVASAPHAAHGIGAQGPPTPSTAYWLLIVLTHLAANWVCALVCLRHLRDSGSRRLRVAVILFSSGTLFASLFWLGVLCQLAAGPSWPLSLKPFFLALHGLLTSAALTVPSVAAIRQAVTESWSCWRIWPMWRELTDACPNVALAKPRPRLLEVLSPKAKRRLLLYRQVVEIHDAMLVLHDYAPAEAHARARHLSECRGQGTDRAATALAYLLKEARRAKLAGYPPQRHAATVTGPGCADLAEERAFLTRVAQAYATAPVPEFPSPAAHRPAGRHRTPATDEEAHGTHEGNAA
ncbi:MAB_1171c family putative transporter [Streptomyces sp. NPDC056373]|uniref:MAB_1171c family putative transporter n=1 Tax=Streptomyces sp. NPDC056373 TaxID=3345798 RepID=UPI0035DC2D6A